MTEMNNLLKNNVDAHVINNQQNREDILLSDITVRFDNEIETLYYGPVEIKKEPEKKALIQFVNLQTEQNGIDTVASDSYNYSDVKGWPRENYDFRENIDGKNELKEKIFCTESHIVTSKNSQNSILNSTDNLKNRKETKVKNIIECSQCNMVFKSETWYRKHLDNFHQTKVVQNKLINLKTKLPEFNSEIKKEIKCEVKDVEFQSSSDVKNSKIIDILDDAINKAKNQPYRQLNKENVADEPQIINANVESNKIKVPHQFPIEIVEVDSKKYLCSRICNEEIDSNIVMHLTNKHSKIKRKICSHCGKTFTATGDLNRHLRIHTGDKPFKCQYPNCKYSFISTGDLNKHFRRHSSIPVPRLHACVDCGKSFERGYDLKRHRTRHQMSDPNYDGFKCELCGKKFARKDQYRAHTYRHIGYKPYKCEVCSKTFSDASNYSKHSKIHTMNEGPLICNYCNRSFKNKMAISKHIFSCQERRILIKERS